MGQRGPDTAGLGLKPMDGGPGLGGCGQSSSVTCPALEWRQKKGTLVCLPALSPIPRPLHRLALFGVGRTIIPYNPGGPRAPAHRAALGHPPESREVEQGGPGVCTL